MEHVKNLISRDVSRCNDSLCPKAEDCRRFLQLEIDKKNKETHISITDFGGREGECDYYLTLSNSSGRA